MNLFISRQTISARFVAFVAVSSLILSAFPASFFVAFAASTGVTLNASTLSTTIDEQVNFVVSAILDVSTSTPGTYIEVSDDSITGSIYDGNTGGQCNSSSVDTDGKFDISKKKGVCYSNSTPGVYVVTVQLLTAVDGEPIGSPATVSITVTEPEPVVDDSKKVDICHWNGSSFEFLNVSENSIGTAHGSSGVNDGDIIPTFGEYLGQNLDEVYVDYNGVTGQELLDNGCVAPEVIVVTPPLTCTLTITSDNTDYVVEKNVLAQALTFVHANWLQEISGSIAAWIWGDNPVADTTVTEVQTFEKKFNWTGGTPTSATLKVASDNTNEITLGTFTGGSANEYSFSATQSYDVASAIVAGLNTLSIEVTNIATPSDTNPQNNPAGLIYELTIEGEGESCGEFVPTTPTEPGDDNSVVASLIITSPAVENEVASGTYMFAAEYIDDDEVVDLIQWAIRAGTCSANTGTVAGNVDGFNDTSSFVGSDFTATLDTSTWAPGTYCFVVNPKEQTGETDLRATRYFVIEDNSNNEEFDDTDTDTDTNDEDDSNDSDSEDIDQTENDNNEGSSRSGSRRRLSAAPRGQVLGASTSAPSCGKYLLEHMRLGYANDSWEVTKLQFFLTAQGFFTPTTGIFDVVTDKNVRLFQEKLSTEILVPWVEAGFMSTPESTGYVYLTTKFTINNLVCSGSEPTPILR